MLKPTLPRRFAQAGLAAALLAAGLNSTALASSHREAPGITNAPKADATDFYMYRSPAAANRPGYVTLVANYLPLQDPYGGPNYFKLDPNALYEIHIDNNGNAVEDITFQFRFTNTYKEIPVPALGAMVAIPLTQGGFISDVNDPESSVRETFTLDVVRGGRRSGTKTPVMNGSSPTFDKPVDNIGTKTIADYVGYAAKHIYTVNIPGCTSNPSARVFVGQRKDPFKIALGTVFDLVNAPVAVITDPANINAGMDDLADKNVTSLMLEVHKDCLTAATGATNGPGAVIGGWTSASLRQGQLYSGSPKSGYDVNALKAGPWTQVSRLGMPLVNEVVIGLKDKDKFNASQPSGDVQFLQYVTNPTLPVLIDIALGLGDPAVAGDTAPTNTGRMDLQAVFLTGVVGVNQMTTVTPSEMLRLNTAIEPAATPNRLGVIGGDLAGYPNGRRLTDDIVDISLAAVMGGLCVANGDANTLGFGAACKPSAVPLGMTSLLLHDTVDQAVMTLLPAFPYLNTPLPGATAP